MSTASCFCRSIPGPFQRGVRRKTYSGFLSLACCSDEAGEVIRILILQHFNIHPYFDIACVEVGCPLTKNYTQILPFMFGSPILGKYP